MKLPNLLFTKLLLHGTFLSVALVLGAPHARAQHAGQWRDARQIYDKVCAYCHQGGVVGPVILGRQLEPTFVAAIVRHGRGAMPAFRATEFTQAELESLGRMIYESSPPITSTQEAGK